MAMSREAEIHKILSAVVQKRPILTMWEMCKQSAPVLLPQEVWTWYGGLSASERQNACQIDDKEWLTTTQHMWQKMLPDASNGGLAIRESLCDTKAEELIHVVSFDHTSFSCLLPHAAAVRDGTSIKNMITEVLYDGFRTTTEYHDQEIFLTPARLGSLNEPKVKLEFLSFGAFVAEKLQTVLESAYKNRKMDATRPLPVPLGGASEIVLMRERLSKFLLTLSKETFQQIFGQHSNVPNAEDIGTIITNSDAAGEYVLSLCSSRFCDFGSSTFVNLVKQFRSLSNAYAEALASSFDEEDIRKAAQKAEIKRRRKLKQLKKKQLRKERKAKEQERIRLEEEAHNASAEGGASGDQVATTGAADDGNADANSTAKTSCRRGRKKRRGKKKRRQKKNADKNAAAAPDALPTDEASHPTSLEATPVIPAQPHLHAHSTSVPAQKPVGGGPHNPQSETKPQTDATTPPRSKAASAAAQDLPKVPPSLLPDDDTSSEPPVPASDKPQHNSPLTVGAKWMKNNSISLGSHKSDVEKISKVLKSTTSAPMMSALKSEKIGIGIGDVNMPSTSIGATATNEIKQVVDGFDAESKTNITVPTPDIHQRILHFLMPRECGHIASVCTKWRRWVFVGFPHHSSFKGVGENIEGNRVPLWQDPVRSHTSDEDGARKTFFGKSTHEGAPFWHWGVSPERHWKLHVELLDMASSLVRIARQRRPFQLAVVNAARVAVLQLWPGASVEVYGSFKHGLCGPGSDVDLVICDVLEHYENAFNSKSSTSKDSQCLIMLAEHLRTQEWAEEVQAITNATVPLIKMSASFEEAGRGKIWLDISFVSPIHRGLSTCVFVNLQMSLHPKLRPLVLVLKSLLKTKGLNEPLSGGLSSYCLVLMVTAMLKVWKQYYPTVHPNLGTLFLFFLYLFGIVFDPAKDGLTVAPSTSTPFFPRRGSMHLLTLFQFLTKNDPARAPAAVSIFLAAQALTDNQNGRLPPIPPPRSKRSSRRSPKRRSSTNAQSRDQPRKSTSTAHDMSLLDAASEDPGWWVNQKTAKESRKKNRSAQELYNQLSREYGYAPSLLLQRDRHVNMTQPKFEYDPLVLVDPLNHQNNLGSNCHAILPLRAQLALALRTAATAEMGSQSNILGAIFSASHHQRVIELQEKLWCPPNPLDMAVDESILVSAQAPTEPQSDATMTRHRRQDSLPKSLAHSVHQLLTHMMVSAERVAVSVNELHWLLPDRWYAWLARYVVHTYCVQRQCHDALLAFTLLFDLPQTKPTLTPRTRGDSFTRNLPVKRRYRNPFQRLVRRESIEYAITILNAGVVITDTTTRKNLKICGRWIGLLTLARNKPLLQAELDLKKLLDPSSVEHLLLVVPFIVQIMMAAGQSRVFRPPNPWTRAIIKALRRTYHRTNVNLSVKYEIEVLCRHLGLSSTLHSVSQDDPADARGDRALESWAADALCCLQRITAPRPKTSFQARDQPRPDRGAVMIKAAELDHLKELIRRYPRGSRSSMRTSGFTNERDDADDDVEDK